MKKIFLLLVLLALPTAWLRADGGQAGAVLRPKHYADNGQRFGLKHPVGIVADPEFTVLADRLVRFLSEKGCRSFRGNASVRNKIFIRKADRIEGAPPAEKDAYAFRVTENRVYITVTSPKAAQWAYHTFRKLYAESSPLGFARKLLLKKYLRGCEITDWDANDPEYDDEATLDVTTAFLPADRICERIARLGHEGKSTLYLVLVSPEGWAVQSDVFRLINPRDDIHTGRCLTYAEVERIRVCAEANGLELVPVFDLLSASNPDFERVTGHRMHSVEGMRFIRALLEEYGRNLSPGRVCIGEKDGEAASAYAGAIGEMVRKTGKEPLVR